jgi:hypothetical protein
MELGTNSNTLIQSNIDDTPFKSDQEVSAEVARGDKAAANISNNKLFSHQQHSNHDDTSSDTNTSSSPSKFRRYPRLGAPMDDTGYSQFYFSIGYVKQINSI